MKKKETVVRCLAIAICTLVGFCAGVISSDIKNRVSQKEKIVHELNMSSIDSYLSSIAEEVDDE